MELKAFLAKRCRPLILALDQVMMKASVFSLIRKERPKDATMVLGICPRTDCRASWPV